MADLTAHKALERAAENLEKSETARGPDYEMFLAAAQAYTSYATAYVLFHQHVEVRTGGI